MEKYKTRLENIDINNSKVFTEFAKVNVDWLNDGAIKNITKLRHF
jgi:hypothetical protein